jgi:hypothetical protein
VCGVSFGTYARKVRDTTLPYNRRVSAFRSSVQLYHPIGFHASLSFVETIAGQYERDATALLRALDVVIASRDEWLVDVRAYAESRRMAKRLGSRSPGPNERNPNRPDQWYGKANEAALHFLRFNQVGLRQYLPGPAGGMPGTSELSALVEISLATNGVLSRDQQALLAETIATLRSRLRPDLWRDDHNAYYHLHRMLHVATQLQTAAGTRPPI